MTDFLGYTQTVTTDGNGDYSAFVPPGSTTADVDESTSPGSFALTAGVDPAKVDALGAQTALVDPVGHQSTVSKAPTVSGFALWLLILALRACGAWSVLRLR